MKAVSIRRLSKEVYVPSGKARKVVALYGANSDCSPWNINDIEVRRKQEPKNGILQIASGEVVSAFKKDSPAANCGGKKVRALNIVYKATSEFVGTDEFELFVMWPNGRASEMSFTVNVE